MTLSTLPVLTGRTAINIRNEEFVVCPGCPTPSEYGDGSGPKKASGVSLTRTPAWT